MADEKIKISELDVASQSEFTDDALLALDVEDQNSETGYSTKSGLLSRLIAYIKTKLTAADISYSQGVSVADKLDNLANYSTTEKAVGTWINGKTIYQKTVSIGALPNNTTTGYEVVGEAIETLVDISVIATDTTGDYFIVLPNLSSSPTFQISYDVEIENGKTKVFIVTARDVTSYSGVVTIRYTKR